MEEDVVGFAIKNIRKLIEKGDVKVKKEKYGVYSARYKTVELFSFNFGRRSRDCVVEDCGSKTFISGVIKPFKYFRKHHKKIKHNIDMEIQWKTL